MQALVPTSRNELDRNASVHRLSLALTTPGGWTKSSPGLRFQQLHDGRGPFPATCQALFFPKPIDDPLALACDLEPPRHPRLALG